MTVVNFHIVNNKKLVNKFHMNIVNLSFEHINSKISQANRLLLYKTFILETLKITINSNNNISQFIIMMLINKIMKQTTPMKFISIGLKIINQDRQVLLLRLNQINRIIAVVLNSKIYYLINKKIFKLKNLYKLRKPYKKNRMVPKFIIQSNSTIDLWNNQKVVWIMLEFSNINHNQFF